ncbi:NAD-dependent deacylase [Loktanella sp. S4079]|uniref:NAD-dependent deacylase n=1 Tax=Loktanella sp. S4079 TaxID=579483 RepID=UPI0005FA1E99|nr:NAD-dependent deacylase [Loktanella sp. S4079]KJZ19602.1 NAD-dependent deacetylase [Loktanella sp. S4079]
MKIAILTGAGLSAESGLGTFRDKGGIWTKYDLTQVATPEGFAADPALVHEFYNARRANCVESEPNAAHFALGELQSDSAHEVTIITQNIDDLHERGGAKDVIHMHGQLLRALCANCGERWDAPIIMTPTDLCPRCSAPQTRPDVVWFGEIPYAMETIQQKVSESDLFVAIGTSATVYPAAGLVQLARGETRELNLAPTDAAGAFDSGRYGPATSIVPEWVQSL